MNRRGLFRTVLAGVLGAAVVAATLPARRRKIIRTGTSAPIVPAPPGGTLDLVMRIIADDLQTALGQPIVIEGKAGGAGMVGVREMLNSPRDGYTIIIHISGIVSEIPHIAKAPYDPFKDITPLIDLARTGLVFVGSPKLPVIDAERGDRLREGKQGEGQLRVLYGRNALACARHPVQPDCRT